MDDFFGMDLKEAAAAGVPEPVMKIFAKAAQIAGWNMVYVWDGGHDGTYEPTHGEDADGPIGYDCSGFADACIHHGLPNSLPGTVNTEGLEKWGEAGEGTHFTLHVINNRTLAHCILEFHIPGYPNKQFIAARHEGTIIRWYPLNELGPWLKEGYQQRRAILSV
jgi:hypothetical protein